MQKSIDEEIGTIKLLAPLQRNASQSKLGGKLLNNTLQIVLQLFPSFVYYITCIV